jgi:hypothetical protein
MGIRFKMKLWLLLFSSFVFAPSLSWGAACCGGGFAAPTIIAGDDKAQLTTSYSFTEVAIDNVDSRGIWRKWDEHQMIQSFRIEGAHLISDRWQTGFALPLVQRSRMNEDFSGLGDISTTIGYEYLPDWDYNLIRPKGIGYIQLTLPTGKSRAESEVGGLDSRGNGFWALGLGTLLTKAVGKYDLFSSLEIHRSFSKSVSNSQIQGSLVPGLGGNLGLGGGYNLQSIRIGGSLTWTYEDPIDVRGNTSSKGLPERHTTALLSASYMTSDEWAGTLSYSDQTLFGSPVNTSLGKSVALMIQRRWGR